MKQNKVCTNLAQDFTDAEKAQGRSNIGAVSASEVSTAISNAVGQLDVSDNVTANQFVTSVSESDGRVSVTRRQPVIADVQGLEDELSRITPQVQSDWTETDENLPSFVKHKPDLSVYATNAALEAGLSTKQGTLTAGSNIQIDADNVISATDTKYTAGTNVQISSGNVISATDTKYTAGTNVQISSGNVISATDTKYTAGSNIQIDANNVISATDTKYTAGSGLALNGTQFSNTAPNVKSDWNAAAGSSSEILNKPSVPSIKTTSTTLPPVDTNVSNLTLFTDGRVTVNNSTDVGLLAPIGTQSDAGKVLTGAYSGSPGKFTAAWTPVQSPLSAGNGITISSNVVSAKIKSNGGLVLDSNGLAVDSSFSGMFIGTYSQSVKTPYNDYKTAYDAGKAVYLRMTALGGDAMFQLYDIDSSKAVFTRIVGVASVYYTDSVVSTIIVSSSNVYSTYNTELAAKADLASKNPTLSTSGSLSTYSNNTKLRLRKFNVASTGSWVGPGVSGTTTCGSVTRIYTNFDSSHLYAFPCPQNTSSYNTFSPIFRKIVYDGVLKFTNNTGSTDYVASIEPGNYQSSSSITTWCDEAVCRVMVETGVHFVKIRGSAFYEVGIEYTNEPTSNSNRCLRVNAMSSSVSYEVMELFTKCVDYYYSAD